MDHAVGDEHVWYNHFGVVDIYAATGYGDFDLLACDCRECLPVFERRAVTNRSFDDWIPYVSSCSYEACICRLTMIAEDLRQLRSGQFRDLRRDLRECSVIWREDGKVRCGVNCLH